MKFDAESMKQAPDWKRALLVLYLENGGKCEDAALTKGFVNIPPQVPFLAAICGWTLERAEAALDAAVESGFAYRGNEQGADETPARTFELN